MAIGLDRNHDGAVEEVVVDMGDDLTTVRLVPLEPGADLTLERYSADTRTALLTEQLGREVRVEA